MFTYQHPNDLLGWILLAVMANGGLLFAIFRRMGRIEDRSKKMSDIYKKMSDTYLDIQALKKQELDIRLKLAAGQLRIQQARKPAA